MPDPIIDNVAGAIVPEPPTVPGPATSLAGRVWEGSMPLREVGRAVSTARAYAQHSAQAREAARNGDHDTAEDSLGESLVDLAQGIPVVGGVVSLGRRVHDGISTRLGGPTLGQRVGRSGPHTDISDLEAADRIERGDTQPHATGGNDNDRRRRNREHEARVQAQIRRQQQQRQQQQAAQEAEARRQSPNGHPMDVDPGAAAERARQLQQRAATANTPSYDVNRAFRPLTAPRLGPTGYPTLGAEIELPLDEGH